MVKELKDVNTSNRFIAHVNELISALVKHCQLNDDLGQVSGNIARPVTSVYFPGESVGPELLTSLLFCCLNMEQILWVACTVWLYLYVSDYAPTHTRITTSSVHSLHVLQTEVPEEKGDFADFRYNVGELMHDMVFIVGSVDIFQQVWLQLVQLVQPPKYNIDFNSSIMIPFDDTIKINQLYCVCACRDNQNKSTILCLCL